MSMLKLKLIAIPVTPYLPTNKSAKSRSRIKVMIEISVFAFIFPTAERRFPYRFLKSIFPQKAANSILKGSVTSLYFKLKKR